MKSNPRSVWPQRSLIFFTFVLVINLYLLRCLFLWAGHWAAASSCTENPAPSQYVTVSKRWYQAQWPEAKGPAPKVSPWFLAGRYILTRAYDVEPEVFGAGSAKRMLAGYTGLKYFLNSHFYRWLLPDFPIMPLSEQGDQKILIERSEKPYLLPAPESVSPAREASLKRKVEFFQALRERYPGLNIFVYHIRLAEFSSIYDELTPGSRYRLNGESLSRQFSSALPTSFGYAGFNYGLPQFREYFYRSDHHWNAKGAWAAYVEALQLIRTRVPDIGAPLAPGRLFKVDNIAFRGAYAKKAMYEGVADDLWDMKVDMPAYELFYNGHIRLPRSDREALLDGRFKATSVFENYYAVYWGMNYGFLRYASSPGKRNLLLFVDSYANSMEEYFSAHYSNVYVIDVRVFVGDTQQTFKLAAFLKDHPVDDVLFFMDTSCLLFEEKECLFWDMLGDQ